MAGKNGGKRPGAGRPKGRKNAATLSKEQARDALRRLLDEHAHAMHAAQIAHSKGLNYLVARNKRTGKFVKLTQDLYTAILEGHDHDHESIEIWPKDPSIQAYTDLMNRYMDKPIEPPHDLNVKHDGVLKIIIEKPW